MKKNVWFISQYAGGPGIGMQYRQYHFARTLMSMGHDAVIFSGSYSHLYDHPPAVHSNGTEQMVDGVRYIWVKNPRYSKSISMGRLWNMLVFAWNILFVHCNQLSPPDAIIVSSPSMLPIVAALRWKRKYRCKVFFEVRDIWPLTLQELGGLSPFHPVVLFMRFFEKMAYRKADRVISLLPNASAHFEEGGMDKRKFAYLPNGVELTVPEASPSFEWPAEIPANAFVVGYGGSVGRANALHVLIDAAIALKEERNIHFVIIGKGDSLSDLKEKCYELNTVHFLPPVEKRVFLSAIRRFDLCYIGLEKEPLFRFGISPNKLFDYMMARRPILSAIDAANSPVDEAQCGFAVEAGNVDAVKEAILHCRALSPHEREKLGNNGGDYVITHHSYERLTLRLLNWINE